MNMQIYSTKYHDQFPEVDLNHLMAALPAGIIDKVQRFKKWQNAYSYLLGRHLLKAALRGQGFQVNMEDLQYNQYGRPYLPDGPDFNISHSGNRVVCVVSKKGRVGIDLEERKKISIDEFKSQFCEDEWNVIVSAEEPLNIFYHFWTAKESLSKADGRGLTLPLRRLKVANGNIICLDNNYWNIRSLSFFNNYSCHIAAEEIVDAIILREISPEMLANINLL